MSCGPWRFLSDDFILRHPFLDPGKIPAPMMAAELALLADSRRRHLERQDRRHISLAHQAEPETLDAVVNMDAVAFRACRQRGRNPVFGVFPH